MRMNVKCIQATTTECCEPKADTPYPPLRSMLLSPLVVGTRINVGLPLSLVIGFVSAVMDFFLGGGWSLGDAEVGITGVDFSGDNGEAEIVDGESSATEVRVV